MIINIFRDSRIVKMCPWPKFIEPSLTYRKVTHKFGPGSKMTFSPEHLYKVEGDTGVFPAGLLPRVKKLLTANGFTLNITDYRDIANLMPEPDFSRVEALRPGQDKILLAVASSDGGLLVGGCGVGKSFLITQICLMYPTLKIVILSPRVSVVNTIYENLTAKIASTAVCKVCGTKKADPNSRITIATTKSALKCDLKGCDLLLFDEAHGVGCNQIAEHLGYVEKARRFGFTATPVGRSDGADLVIEAVFGPKLADIPYSEAVEHNLVTPIEVRIVDVDSCGYLPDSELITSKKRWHYWRNSARNRVIAAAARALPAGEQILIMVDTLEHALYLSKLLPEFTLVHYGSVDEKRAKRLGQTKESLQMSAEKLDNLRRDFASGALKKVIATMVWAEGVNFPDLSCLIRADGAPGEIKSEQIPGRLSRLSEGKDVGILIDFNDKFSPWAASRSIKRINFYRRKGWKVRALNV